MLKEIIGLPREYRNRVKRDEVIDRLSFGIWKTCNRILEEVGGQRIVAGKEPPVSIDEAFWFSPKVDTRMYLVHLQIMGVVEMKYEDELTTSDQAWASKSDSNADEEEARFKENHGNGALAFYKLVRSGIRERDREETPVVGLDPVLVR